MFCSLEALLMAATKVLEVARLNLLQVDVLRRPRVQ